MSIAARIAEAVIRGRVPSNASPPVAGAAQRMLDMAANSPSIQRGIQQGFNVPVSHGFTTESQASRMAFSPQINSLINKGGGSGGVPKGASVEDVIHSAQYGLAADPSAIPRLAQGPLRVGQHPNPMTFDTALGTHTGLQTRNAGIADTFADSRSGIGGIIMPAIMKGKGVRVIEQPVAKSRYTIDEGIQFGPGPIGPYERDPLPKGIMHDAHAVTMDIVSFGLARSAARGDAESLDMLERYLARFIRSRIIDTVYLAPSERSMVDVENLARGMRDSILMGNGAPLKHALEDGAPDSLWAMLIQLDRNLDPSLTPEQNMRQVMTDFKIFEQDVAEETADTFRMAQKYTDELHNEGYHSVEYADTVGDETGWADNTAAFISPTQKGYRSQFAAFNDPNADNMFASIAPFAAGGASIPAMPNIIESIMTGQEDGRST